MFNVGGPEIVVVILVALLVLGPEQLPKAMRTFGNAMAEIRKVSGGFQDEMRKAMDTMDPTKDSGDFKGQSAEGPASQHGQTPAIPADSDVTEVVARNDGVAGADDVTVAAESVQDRPPVDPADRAAG